MRGFVDVVRGGLVESVHEVHASVVSSSGEQFRLGDPDLCRPFFRSSAKPFQTIGLLLSGAAERFSLGPEDLALISASHAGEGIHTERVQGYLKAMGLTADRLLCGAHPPYDRETAASLSGPPTPLHSNCSGKHSGMLFQALTEQLELDYLSPDHPIQVRNREIVAAFAGLDPAELGVGIDGCGVPTFAFPVRKMAESYLRLVRPEGLAPALQKAAPRVVDAMRQHPYLVGGRGQFSTALMEATKGRWMAKGGAEGVMGVTAPQEGIAMVLKVADGSPRAVPTATLAILSRMELLTPEEEETLALWGRPPLKNVAGRTVGEIRMVIGDERGHGS